MNTLLGVLSAVALCSSLTYIVLQMFRTWTTGSWHAIVTDCAVVGLCAVAVAYTLRTIS